MTLIANAAAAENRYSLRLIHRSTCGGMTGEQIRYSGVTRSYGIRDGHGVLFVSARRDSCR